MPVRKKPLRQVVVVHGGDSFTNRASYVRFLRSIKITGQSLRLRRGWKANLQADLGRGWQVIQPTMPNKLNARYEDWKIWLEKYRPLIHQGAIFIGHSLGGIFLVKYFSEHRWPKKIQAVILVAAPYTRTNGIGDFRLRRPLTKLASQVHRIELFYSIDDPVVPYHELVAYQRAVPHARVHLFTKRGHFTQARFPELVRLLKTI